jgi:hypothetical protein
MARSGTGLGTVIRWDDGRRGGLVEFPDLPGLCWVDAAVVPHGTGHDALRAGQVVEVEWTEAGDAEHPYRAVRVAPRGDLQATVGG